MLHVSPLQNEAVGVDSLRGPFRMYGSDWLALGPLSPSSPCSLVPWPSIPGGAPTSPEGVWGLPAKGGKPEKLGGPCPPGTLCPNDSKALLALLMKIYSQE